MAIVFGALTVGLDLLAKQVVWSRPAWAYELHIITDGKPFSKPAVTIAPLPYILVRPFPVVQA
jgi:hypothetical protein